MKVILKNFFREKDFKKKLLDLGVCKKGSDILSKKYKTYIFYVENISTVSANILKQEALCVGADVALPSKASFFEKKDTKVYLIVTKRQLEKLISRLKEQIPSLQKLAFILEEFLNLEKTPYPISFNGKVLSFEKYVLMGVLNVTPDSFYDGGKYINLDKAIEHAQKLVEEGAQIIDVGGESTRPGATPVSLEEELNRVIPVIKALRENLPKNIFISIDTYKAKVAQEAIKVGADIINDISGLTFDKDMINVLKSTHAPIVINHIKGTPKDMQKNPYYENVLDEVSKFFEEKIETLLKVNYPYTNIILDVGIGFGKRLEDNLNLIKNISHFKKFGLPLLVGTSRKSFIGKVLNLDDPKERLEGTLASNLYLYQQGVNIFRVHDVKEHKRALELLDVLFRH